MSLRKFALIAAMAVGLANVAGTAVAQQAQPARVVVVDEGAVRRGSKVGQLLNAQLTSMRAQGVAQLGLQALQDEIRNETQALAPQVQALTPEQIQANATLRPRVEALNRKRQEFVQKAQQLQSALEQQAQQYDAAFAAAMQPAVQNVATAANADMVVSGNSTWYFKPTVDISARVIARLDATVPTLEALQALVAPPAPAAPAAGAAPALPAAPAPSVAPPAASQPAPNP
jgi:Skp family chaperone for outer membrane proteins